MDEKHFKNEKYMIWAFWGEVRGMDHEIGMGLISIIDTVLGNLLKISKLNFSHLYKAGNKASFIVVK